MNRRYELYLTAGAIAGLVTSIAAMLGMALTSNPPTQRISLLLGLPSTSLDSNPDLKLSNLTLQLLSDAALNEIAKEAKPQVLPQPIVYTPLSAQPSLSPTCLADWQTCSLRRQSPTLLFAPPPSWWEAETK